MRLIKLYAAKIIDPELKKNSKMLPMRMVFGKKPSSVITKEIGCSSTTLILMRGGLFG